MDRKTAYVEAEPNVAGFNYAFWRTDKDKEQGFSRELISCDTKLVGVTDLDTLEALPAEGIDTLLKAL